MSTRECFTIVIKEKISFVVRKMKSISKYFLQNEFLLSYSGKDTSTSCPIFNTFNIREKVDLCEVKTTEKTEKSWHQGTPTES